MKNIETHCEGLSLALFMFTVAGNVTYVLSICTLSMEREHLIANASWLAGTCDPFLQAMSNGLTQSLGLIYIHARILLFLCLTFFLMVDR